MRLTLAAGIGVDFETYAIEPRSKYPPQPVGVAIKEQVGLLHAVYYDYQPGNGTRYEVLFNSFRTKYGRRTVMTIVNMNASMELNGELGIVSIGYMKEKLGLLDGDCYALIQLANTYLEELGQ